MAKGTEKLMVRGNVTGGQFDHQFGLLFLLDAWNLVLSLAWGICWANLIKLANLASNMLNGFPSGCLERSRKGDFVELWQVWMCMCPFLFLSLLGLPDQALSCVISLADFTDFYEFKTQLEIHHCLTWTTNRYCSR